MTHDPIDRFLQDAERAARQGDRERALELLLLALDTAPGDATVLVRAHAIRNLLPTEGARGADSFFGSGTDVVAPAVVAPGEGVGVPNVRTAEPASSIPVAPPGLLLTLQDLDTAVIEEPDRVEEEEMVEFVLPVETEPETAPRPPLFSPTVRKAAIYVLWSALGIGLFTMLLALVHPPAVEGVMRRWQAMFNPLVRAEMAADAGRWDEAASSAREATQDPATAGPAYLLLGRALLAQGNVREARSALNRVVALDSSWVTALHAGRLLLQAGDTASAAQALLFAFERSAPSEYWREIANVLRRAGRAEASNIERLLFGITQAPPIPAAISNR
ncbi:MAG TPA: tetratricopeptide repeat protein [Gemmatimonadaceae bacterium]